MTGWDARSGLATAASLALAGAGLYFAKDFLLPLSLAALLCFLLHPLLRRLEGLGVPRAAAVCALALVLAAGVFALAWLVSREAAELGARLPELRANLVEKLRALRGPIRSAADALGWIDQLQQEVAPAHAQGAAQVEVVQAPAPLTAFAQFVTPLFGALEVAGIVGVLALFLLLQRDLPQRMAAFLAVRDSRLSPRALDEAAQVVTRYLVRQGVVCAVQGVAVAVGLGLVGLPGFLVFGLLSAVLRLIPYFGPSIAAALPIAFALVAFPGWTKGLETLAFFACLELFTNNVLDPRVLGRGAGLSPLGVVLAASFWAWLWGPVGLFVAIPLTACLVVAGRYVPQLAFLPALLGHDPPTSPCDRFYECLLAHDRAEAEILLRHTARESDSLALSDALVLPVLRRMAAERAEGARSGVEVVRMLREFRDLLAEAAMVLAPGAPRPASAQPVQLAQLRAGAIDRFARDWLANVLQERGFAVRERGAPADARALLVVIAPIAERVLGAATRRRLAQRVGRHHAVLLAAAEVGEPGSLQAVRSTVALVAALAPPIAAVAPAEPRAALAEADAPAR
ncbi:MAG TPA: AI-2E family transporter [Myxococcota bacterium]|nr:AI-2E family transporter [Myxococcota bacterium]